MATVPEEDCCRVCRSEGTSEDPLFYPCKCSGSIRYVHQDCLLEWLSHSNKKHCELCKTPFQFTSLYDPAMPKSLPLRQVWRKLVADAQTVVILAMRWLLVSFVWLGWLPYCTRHIWRSSIRVGDQLTANSAGHLRELANLTTSTTSNSTVTNSTAAIMVVDSTDLVLDTFLPSSLSRLTASSMVNKILIEIFEGQIITSVIIIVFVMVFLIREWIVQNNAHLLDENTDFLERHIPARDQARLVAMRLEASPPSSTQSSPSLTALEDSLGEQLHDALHLRNMDDHEDEHRNMEVGPIYQDRPERSSRSNLQTSSPSVSGEWEALKKEATRSAHARQSTSQQSTSENEITMASQQDSDDALVSIAELKAMRREAILRAISKRLQKSEESLLSSNSIGSSISDVNVSPLPQSAEALDVRLARQAGDHSAQGSWKRHARERSIERKIWENMEEVSDVQYPDSPLPAPRPDRYVEDMLQLPAPVQDLPSSDAEDHKSNRLVTMAREIEIAATTRNPSLKTSPDSESINPMLPLGPSARSDVMTDDELEILLHRIREAPTASERAQEANRAIDECILVARSVHPSGNFSKTDITYKETIKQVGKIAMTASQQGSEGIIDVQKAFRLADEHVNNLAHNAQASPDLDQEHGPNADEPLERDDALLVPREMALDAALEPEILPEDLMDDDIDGLLDLIGVRGPIVALLQNSMLVVVMVTGFIVFGICLPYMFGKCVTAVARDPQTYLVRLPIEINRIIIGQLLGAVKLTLQILKFAVPAASRSSQLLDYIANALETSNILAELRGFRSVDRGSFVFQISVSQYLSSLFNKRVLALLSDHAPTLDIYKTMQISGLMIPARLTTTLSGYIGLIMFGVLYVKTNQRLTKGDQGKQVELAIRSFLRQAGYVIKFIVILGIELVIFPFYCGLLLDGVLSPFVPHSSLSERLSFFVGYPFTSLFLHWLVGTVYMFNFALFVSMCREIVRPGLLFFIRDPNDPTFNPIKDILERSIRSQMRKIGISLIIYGGLILVALGVVIKAVARSVPGLLPLSLTPIEPLFEVPIDLLSFQILLPLTFRYAEPHKKIKVLWEYWFRYTSGVLRLSSFVMGERKAAEEGYMPLSLSNCHRVLTSMPDPESAVFVHDGTFRRVPATDSLPMRVGKEMIMLVSEDNVLIGTADEEDETRDDTNYTVVYAPPMLQFRIYFFLFLLWAFAAVVCVAGSLAPLLSGRFIAHRLSPHKQVHDVSAFMYGIYAMAALLLSVSKAKHTITGLQRLVNHGKDFLLKPNHVASTVSSTADLVLRWLYLLSTLSVVIPVLLGLSLETYVIIPVGLWLNPAYTPTIHLVHDWIVGLVYVKIIGRTAMMMPTNIIGQALNNTMRNDWRRGWRNPDLRIATKHLILPVTAILLAALLIPLSVAAVARWTVYYEAPNETGTLLYRMSYPATLITGLLILGCHYAAVLAHKWRATVRDALYLRGRQLHNFGESRPPTMVAADETNAIATLGEGDRNGAAINQDTAGVLSDILDSVEAEAYERD